MNSSSNIAAGLCLFAYERVDLLGAVFTPKWRSFPKQHASPVQISRRESAPASWQNSIETNWDQLVNPLACLSAPCFLTILVNSVCGKN